MIGNKIIEVKEVRGSDCVNDLLEKEWLLLKVTTIKEEIVYVLGRK